MASRFFQFLFDFSEPETVLPDRQPATVMKTPESEQNVLAAQEASAHSAINNIATSEPLEKTSFRHPSATREILLNGKVVAFQVKRRKRRTIGFSVSTQGLAVSAPQWVPLYEIDRAVQGKSGWILKKLQETHERRGRLDAAQIDWKNGTLFPFLGNLVRLVLNGQQSHGTLQASPTDGEATQSLCINLPADAGPAQIEHVVQVWVMQQATQVFTNRLNHFAPQLNVQWLKLSLSSAATRWGSANASGAIRLNWRLMHFNQEMIDYVVVHELSHLRVMDHSPRFWATVQGVMPNYAFHRNQLKKEIIPRK